MTAHRWVFRGDAPPHGPGCEIEDCCWSLLSAVPDPEQDPVGPATVTPLFAGWCPIHDDTDLDPSGVCVRCSRGGAA